jgi:hypothetical protein
VRTVSAAARSAGEIGDVACGIECRRHIKETPVGVIPDIVELDAQLKASRFVPADRNIFDITSCIVQRFPRCAHDSKGNAVVVHLIYFSGLLFNPNGPRLKLAYLLSGIDNG